MNGWWDVGTVDDGWLVSIGQCKHYIVVLIDVTFVANNPK